MTATLLVVDDEPQILQAVSGILQDEGFEVLTAPDGETALKRLGEALPALVFLGNALETARLSEENRRLRQQTAPVREIIGESDPIRKLREQLRIVAPTNASVLISGENGSGKELVARAIHALSRRAYKSFVEVNCAALPEELIESELFGPEKGAFAGHTTRRRGKFDLAH